MKKSVRMINKMAAIKRWNELVPVGSPVEVTMDDASVKQTMTTSEAWLLGGHTPVIMLEGISGAYALARVASREFPAR